MSGVSAQKANYVQNPENEVLLPAEAADLLRLTESQLFELTRARAQQRHERPLPVIRVGKHLRFSRTALLAWINAGGSRD